MHWTGGEGIHTAARVRMRTAVSADSMFCFTAVYCGEVRSERSETADQNDEKKGKMAVPTTSRYLFLGGWEGGYL